MNEIMKKNPEMMGSTPYDRELYGRKDGINAPSIPFAQWKKARFGLKAAKIDYGIACLKMKKNFLEKYQSFLGMHLAVI